MNTSLFVFKLSCKSLSAPNLANIKWSAWAVEGTATLSFPACINWRSAICAVASCIATLSGAKST